MSGIINWINNILSIDSFMGNLYAFLPKIFNALFVIIIYFLLWKIIDKILSSSFKKLNTEKTLNNFITNIGIAIITIVASVTILSIFGVKTGSILASLGVVGLAIVFAAQDALSNVISGLFIFWDKPFVIDDLIEISGNYGKVDKITMRTTKVITVDGKMLTIPNKEVINSIVASYTNFLNFRIDINFTVGTNEDINKIREILFNLVKNENKFLKKPEPEIVLNSINDYDIGLIFRVWIRNEKEHLPIAFDIREKLLNELIKENINMPYETLDININN